MVRSVWHGKHTYPQLRSVALVEISHPHRVDMLYQLVDHVCVARRQFDALTMKQLEKSFQFRFGRLQLLRQVNAPSERATGCLKLVQHTCGGIRQLAAEICLRGDYPSQCGEQQLAPSCACSASPAAWRERGGSISEHVSTHQRTQR